MFDIKNTNTCQNCLVRSHLFSFLKKEDLHLVNSNRNEITFKKGEVILKQGIPMSHIIFVKSGFVKIYMEGVGNKNLILSITKSGNYINGPSLYYDNISHYSVSALTEVETCFINTNTFKELVKRNYQFMEAFLHEFNKRAITTFYTYLTMTQKKMYGRMSSGLIYLSEVYGNSRFDVLLTKKEIGELTNMTKESVIRTLKNFEDENIINCTNGTIEILNMKKLEEISKKG